MRPPERKGRGLITILSRNPRVFYIKDTLKIEYYLKLDLHNWLGIQFADTIDQ